MNSENTGLQRVYARLPVLLQNALCCVYGAQEAHVRFGRAFERRLEELLASDLWSAADLEALQNERLRETVRRAYSGVPFYRELMRGLHLAPDDIRGRRDLPKLPVLTKDEVRRQGPRLLSADRGRRLVSRHTSGSTGAGLHFYAGRDAIAFQWAVWWRHRARFGFRFGDWHANFSGRLAAPASQSRPPYWRWNLPGRQAVVNMHHLTREKAEDIAAFLDRQAFAAWVGYPSFLHSFALFAMEAGVALRYPPRLIVTGAEKMWDFQRRDIAAFTGAVLTDQYGFAEGCGNASQCPHLAYHEDSEFGVLECGSPERLGDGRVRGRILATGFASPEQPFLRYETGDTGIWSEHPAPCACGRSSPVLLAIEGRNEDYVLTPEGRRIMRFDYIFKDALNVKESQVVQRRSGEITVRVVRRPQYALRDERRLAREIAAWISPRLRVHFEYVAKIEREPNGKFRAVKSELGRSAAGGV